VIVSRGVDRFFRNFELLGSPIGDAEFCSSFVKSFTKKAVAHTLGPLSSLDDPQVVHMLLRLCASFCRVVHLLRGVPIIFCTAAMQEFDAAVRKAFAIGVGVQFSDTAWKQVSLPMALGGAGMRCASEHSSGAYVASVANAAAKDGWDCRLAPGWDEAVLDVCARSGCDSVGSSGSQKAFSEAIDKKAFSALLDMSSDFNKARLLSASGKGASSWMGAVPSATLGYLLDPREYSTLLKLWCGLPIYDKVCACPGCGVAMDVFGYHALSCRHMGSFGIRHNVLREIFLKYLKLAHIEAEREAPSLIPGTGARPADVFLPHYEPPSTGASIPACLDFAISHPQQPNILQRASVVCGAAAEQYETGVKDVAFSKVCKEAFGDRAAAMFEEKGMILVPMVVEVFGRWGLRAEEMFAFVAKVCAARANERSPRADAFMRRSLSVALQRCNASILLTHFDPQMPVLDEPVPLADILSLQLPGRCDDRVGEFLDA